MRLSLDGFGATATGITGTLSGGINLSLGLAPDSPATCGGRRWQQSTGGLHFNHSSASNGTDGIGAFHEQALLFASTSMSDLRVSARTYADEPRVVAFSATFSVATSFSLYSEGCSSRSPFDRHIPISVVSGVI